MKKKTASIKKTFLPAFLFAALLFSSCSKNELDDLQVATNPERTASSSTTTNVAAPLPGIPSVPLISITHGACMGSCPNYTVTLSPQGDVIYNGLQNVVTLGTVRYKISAEEANQLGEMMVKEGFLKFADEYAMIPDAQRFETSLFWQGKMKTVVDYGIHVPPSLIAMRQKVESVLNISRLVNGEPVGATEFSNSK